MAPWNASMAAQDHLELELLKENVDNVYLVVMGIFLIFMQAGFAMLEAGAIRSKNVTNIMMKNTMDIFISCISYWLIGYAVAYGQGNSFIGGTYFAGAGLPQSKMAHWFFQFSFAATASSVLSGSVAERCSFVAYITYSSAIPGFIYPVASHWAWADNGWLNVRGFTDFGGAGVVHLLAGTCSFVGAVLLGPRIGRFEGVPMPGHSVALTGLGGIILIGGFLAFNAGSLGSMTGKGGGATIASVVANTVMGGAGAAVTAMLSCRFACRGPRAWCFSDTLNAGLAGIVAMCAGANVLHLWAAFVIGCIAALVFLIIKFLVPYFKVDDPLDATAVHFGGGLTGMILSPVFKKTGIVFGPNKHNLLNLGWNAVGVLAIMLWSGALSTAVFGTLKVFNYLRTSEETELSGMDASKHKELAYPEAFSLHSINHNDSFNNVSLRSGHIMPQATPSSDIGLIGIICKRESI